VAKKVDFETSTELRRLFSQELSNWCSKNRLGIEDLSARCGVSRSYLSHVGRYGRIPSKPVLILLALNFGMKDPGALLRAARLDEPWPFESPASIQANQSAAQSFLSIKLDMDGFMDAIKSAVRDQFKPRSFEDLLDGRPLRLGLNLTQPWLFESSPDGTINQSRGLVPELIAYLENSLRCQIQAIPVPFSRHVEKLKLGEIDLFGPMLAIPHAPSNIPFSLPVNRIGLSALMRQRETSGLAPLAVPATFDDLRNPQYRIAVIKDSRAHLIANTRLNRQDSALIICDTIDEGIDRILLKGVSRPAHIFICNSMIASYQSREHPQELLPLFDDRATMIDICDNSFAIRPDWPEALPRINQALSFIMSSGGFSKRSEELAQRYSPGIFGINIDPPLNLGIGAAANNL
jgi:hypothetical protein